MKNIFPALICIVFIACQPTHNSSSSQNTSADTLQDSTLISSSNKEINQKYLITESSAGYFKIGKAWQSIATKEYALVYTQGYGICVDACCDGGYVLGIKMDEAGEFVDEGLLTIGCIQFDDDESQNKHKDNPDVFYASSDNCKAWYWKDKISYILLYSDLFKTKEGIGVGTTLEELQQKFGKLQFHIGWIEEDPNAFQIKLADYPTVQFILDVEAYKGDWEQLSLTRDKNELSIADFKANTKIDRILVKQKLRIPIK